MFSPTILILINILKNWSSRSDKQILQCLEQKNASWRPSRTEGMETNQAGTNTWYKQIVIGVQNDQMLEITLLPAFVSFGVGSNTRISRGGSNPVKKALQVESVIVDYS